MTRLPSTPSEIDAEWLRELLMAEGHPMYSDVDNVCIERFDHPRGHMSEVARLVVDLGPTRRLHLICKLPSPVPAVREVARRFRLWERECRFYHDLAPTVPIRTPRCLGNRFEPSSGLGVLVLEDLSALRPGDQRGGDAIDDVREAVRCLAPLHAATRRVSRADVPWAPLLIEPDFGVAEVALAEVLPRFLDAYADVLPARARRWLESARGGPARLLHESAMPMTVLHGDFRLDNLLFDGASVVALDWQATALGSPLYDLACFLGGSLSIERRRRHEAELLDIYHAGLRAAGWSGLRRGVVGDAYRRATLVSMLVTTVHVGKVVTDDPTVRAQLREVVRRVFVAADDNDAMAATSRPAP